jgi:mono/diheme cytochrome c family protein
MEQWIRKSTFITLFVTLIILSTVVACSGSSDDSNTLDIERPAPPADYAGKSNPLADDGAALEAGKKLYSSNCVSCHGAEAMGDGPASNSLNPKPKPLAIEMKSLQDDYLFWRISEGGAFAPFTSAMPAWKNVLTEDEIWQIVAFLRSLSK